MLRILFAGRRLKRKSKTFSLFAFYGSSAGASKAEDNIGTK
jgi:hypothetical protein